MIEYCKWKKCDVIKLGLMEYRLWKTKCDFYYEIKSGTPLENSMKYCCYCGKKIKEINNA